MASTLIEVQVFDKETNRSYEGATVSIGGYSDLTARTDSYGKATIVYPYDTGTVDIYVNGESVFSDYLYKLPRPLVVKAAYRY